MQTDTIVCPHCGESIKVTEALAKQVTGDLEKKHNAEMVAQEKRFKDALVGERETLRKQLEAKAAEDAKYASEKASREATDRAAEAEARAQDMEKQLADARTKELELRKAQRVLEDAQKNLELETERRLADAKREIEDKARKAVEDDHRYKDQEKDKKLSDMLAQIEDLKRKAEQQSQQGQGEVLELDLENKLRTAFPHDTVEEVAKGVRGADCVQTCVTPDGRELGKIVWECKRTKTFSGQWPQKVKDDMRAAKADVCCIVTETMPDDIKGFGIVEGAWVCSLSLAVAVAVALRHALEERSKAMIVKAGRTSKAEDVYDYMTGAEFRGRVQAIIEAYVTMQEDLEAEKRTMSNHWARREKQLSRVTAQLSGMHGDLSGIVGDKLQSVKAFELPEGK